MAMSTLKNMPAHTSREILVLFGSLTTCDPSDINSTIKELKTNNVRVSIIGLAAEVRICRHICKETEGEYNVLLDDHHLKELIMNLVQPPVAGGKLHFIRTTAHEIERYYSHRIHGVIVSQNGFPRWIFDWYHEQRHSRGLRSCLLHVVTTRHCPPK